MKDALGNEVSFNVDTLEEDLSSALLSRTNSIKIVRENHLKDTATLSGLIQKLSITNQSLEKKQAELTQKTAIITKKCDGKPYPEIKAKVAQNLDSARDKKESMKAAGGMYNRFFEKYNQSKCCPLCTRGFPNEKPIGNIPDWQKMTQSEFLLNLQKILEKIPERTTLANDVFDKCEKQMAALVGLSSVWDDIQRLENVEIPELVKSKNLYEKEKEEVSNNSENAEVILY